MRTGATVLGPVMIVVAVLSVGCSGDEQRPAADPEQTARLGRALVPRPPGPVVQTPGRLPICLGGPRDREPACDRCQKDEECPSGFCVDGKCANLSFVHGDECNPDWYERPHPTLAGRAVNPCIGYRCIDRRCRSCESDGDCRRNGFDRQYMCGSTPQHPGYHCLSTPMLPEVAARFTPAPVRPAVVAPEGGFPHRSVAAGGGCIRDGDCQSLFCDRGVCVELYRIGNYGRSCDPAEYQGTHEEIRKRSSAEDGCGGFICRDHRCRPCQTDADCPHGLPAKCIYQEGYHGNVCAGLAPPRSANDPNPAEPEP
jgi:hypothetical protein